MSVIRQLIRYEVKATSWISPLLGAGFALGFGLLASRRDPYLASRLNLTRAALLCLATAAAFMLDDRARDLKDPVPTPLRTRRFLHTLPQALFLTAVGTLVLWISSSGLDTTLTMIRAPEDTTLPALRIGLEASATVLLPISIAAALGKRWDPAPGRFAAGVVVLAWMGTWLLPTRYRPWEVPGPGGSMSTALALAVGAAIAFVVTFVASWDSSQHPLIRMRPLSWAGRWVRERE